MRVLDLDLDFFLNRVAQFKSDNERLSDQDYSVWPAVAVRNFLEHQCGLSSEKPIRGRFVEHHDQAFHFWRELIQGGQLEVPFDVVHIDAHADLGMGENAHRFLMTELLAKDVHLRPDLAVASGMLGPGNYLAFALACRWLSSLIYVRNPKTGDDLMSVHFKDCDPSTGVLELKRWTDDEFDGHMFRRRKCPHGVPEPQVPFQLPLSSEYKADAAFSFIVLSQSPGFTPPAADRLIPVIQEYFEPA